MPEIRWLPSFSATCMHLAAGIVRGWPLADERLSPVQVPALALQQALEANRLPAARLWRLLGAYSADIDSNRQLARITLAKAVGVGAHADRSLELLAGHIGAIEAAVTTAIPDLGEQLKLRVRPLQEQWQARGPGLLRLLAKQTDEKLLPEAAQVALMHPAFGGGGIAHLEQNVVCLEAMLANPYPEAPEVVRLAWLIGQLNCDLPLFSEGIPADRLPRVAALALVPPILAAAEEVELVRNSPELISALLTKWRVLGAEEASCAPALDVWWQTLQDTRPAWPVALAALDQMLGPSLTAEPSTR